KYIDWRGCFVIDKIKVIQQALPYLLQGTLVTVKLASISLLLGFCLGLPMAFGQVYGNRVIRGIISVYERVVRSIPLLVILFLIFYGLPAAGIRIPAFTSSILAL